MKTPFDLIEITVHHVGGSTQTLMRPYEFDSEIVNHDKMTNHFGECVKPSKCALTCPGCGAYIDIDMDTLEEGSYEKKCMSCYVPPKLPQILVPFMTPPQRVLDLIYTPVINDVVDNDDDNLSNLLEALDNNG